MEVTVTLATCRPLSSSPRRRRRTATSDCRATCDTEAPRSADSYLHRDRWSRGSNPERCPCRLLSSLQPRYKTTWHLYLTNVFFLPFDFLGFLVHIWFSQIFVLLVIFLFIVAHDVMCLVDVEQYHCHCCVLLPRWKLCLVWEKWHKYLILDRNMGYYWLSILTVW